MLLDANRTAPFIESFTEPESHCQRLFDEVEYLLPEVLVECQKGT